MSGREPQDVLDVESRIVTEESPTLANGQELELKLLPALAARAEIEKANPALVLMRKLVVEIKNELPTLNVATKEGEKRARELRASCVSLRTSTEKAYDAWNKPLLEAQRGIRAVVKEVAEGVTPVETQLDTLIKNIDAAREAEKQRKVEAEQARIAALRTKIEAIMGVTVAAVKLTSAEIDAKIRELQDVVIDDTDESFGEFSDEAAGLRGRVIGELLEMAHAKRAQEDQAAALERQRQEQLEAERRATAERAVRAKSDAIKARAFDAFGKTAAQIKVIRDALQDAEPLALEFGDFYQEARDGWSHALEMVNSALRSQQQLEEQQSEAARHQADLKRQQEELAAAERARAAEVQRQADAEAAAARAKVEREQRIEQRIQNLRDAGFVRGEGGSAGLSKALQNLRSVAIDIDGFGDRVTEAQGVRDSVVLSLEDALARVLDLEAQEAERARQAEVQREREAAELEAREARQLDSEAETFEEVAQNIITTLQLADYPHEYATSKDLAALLTDERVLAQLRAIKDKA